MDPYQKTINLQNLRQKLNKLFKMQKKKKTKKKNKTINDYAKLIQSLKKEYQKLALENYSLKKKLEDKQLTIDLITTEKNKNFLEEKEKTS